MAYYKPQSPIKNGEDYIYPLTTVDQIMLDDGSRLNAKYVTVNLDNAEDDGDVNTTLVNADSLGGLPASDYALKEDVVFSINGIEPDENGNVQYNAPIASVNGKTGAVQLTASDVSARPSSWMPTAADVGALTSSYKADVDSLIKRWNVKTNVNVCANIDNPVQTGFFHCDSTTTGTKPSTHGDLLHITENPMWSEHQLFFTSGDQIWHRCRNNNGTANSAAWSAWKRIMPVQDIYPVGSIYLSVSSTSPASLFGGTWEQLKDRFLLGAGDSYAAGATGGEVLHKLTIDELPSHSFTYSRASGNSQYVRIDNDGGSTTSIVRSVSQSSVYTDSRGRDVSHNNMPPYLAVYMWKRVS